MHIESMREVGLPWEIDDVGEFFGICGYIGRLEGAQRVGD